MPFLLAAVIVVTWAAAGFVVALVLGTALAPLFGVRNMEGYPAMLAFVSVAPFGGVGGAILGIWFVRRYAQDKRKLGIAAAVPWGLAAVVAIVAIIDDSNSGIAPGRSSADIMIKFRLPSGMPAPAGTNDVLAELRADKPAWPLKASFYDSVWLEPKDGDRVVLQGHVETWSRSQNRAIAFRVGDGPTYVFRLKMSASPVESQYGAWQQADLIEEAGSPPRQPSPGEGIDISYGVNLKY